MLDELIQKLEAYERSIEGTNHPEAAAILKAAVGILRRLYDAVVETGTDRRGAIPVVELDSKESAPKGEG